MSSITAADRPPNSASRPVRALTVPATAFIAAVTLAAVGAAVGALVAHGERTQSWPAFVLLVLLAAVAPLFRVSIARNHGFHIGLAFVVAASLILAPAQLLLVVLALQPAQWYRDRSPWYIRLFNLANYSLSALAASTAVETVGGGRDLRFALSGFAAAAVFVFVNHALLAVMLRLARGQTFRASGLFSGTSLAGDLALGGLGVALGSFALFNPWLLPALVAPLLLAHRSFSTLGRLRESEERFRTVFEAAPSAMMMLDTDGRIVAVNRSCELMLGYAADELVGETTPMLRHPDELDELGAVLAELLAGKLDSFRRESRYVRKDGGTVIVQLAVALARDADGKPDHVIAMAEDVTEQRELEERLAQSQKLEAIGRLAGGVAHDFNNMLTAIGGYTDFALEGAPEGSELRRDLDEIRKATDRASALTRQLLAFSRKQVLKPELLNLNAVVVDVESMLRPLVGADVVLETQLDPAIGPIEADPSQLHQVVLNLVVNARDAMPAGGKVVIATANADIGPGDDAIEPGRYVTLTVRDEGEGMNATTLAQIFEPFFTTKDAGKGTGLGLATVYGIVKQSGGYVAVESEEGAGSAFTIYLRRADDARTAAAPPAPATSDRSARIVVVEDEEIVRGLVRQVLAADGHDVVVAEDAEAALALASDDVDVLLTDLTLPGLGGVELAELLRGRLPNLKVIYMSGYADEVVAAAQTRPDGTAFLQKPFAFGDLTRTVRELLSA